MKAYLHFTEGDVLLFDTIIPSSAGAVFGACLIFFLIAIGECYIRALRRRMDRTFSARSQRLESLYAVSGDDSKLPVEADIVAMPPAPSAKHRFVVSQDLSRGVIAGLQTTIHYLLMLVAMSFNASYIISIILGVVVGETAFGRLYT
ncbi:Ctr copper transporter [Schizophyllum fasciatum]